MVRITCPKCGAGTDEPSQKFCTQCGTELPTLPVYSGKHAGIPVWTIAVAAILVLAVAAVILSPLLMQALTGSTSSAGSAGTVQEQPVAVPTDATALPLTTPPPVTTPLQVTTQPEPPVTTIVTPVTTTIPTKATVQRTRATVSTSATTAITATPEPEGTTLITLSVTRIPEQPPGDTYSSTTPGAPYIDPFALETRFHEMINVQRQQNGLSPLSYDSFLASIARGHSYDMVLRNFFEHENPDGLDQRARGDAAGYPCIRDFGTYYTEGLSENLYQGYRYNTYLTAPNGTIVQYNWKTVDQIAEQAVNGWMNSDGHRKNILDYHLQQEGIGVAFSSDDKIYVTENFC